MDINRWLCKTFDEENRGYVTVGDIIGRILAIIFTDDNITRFLIYGALPICIGLLVTFATTTKKEFSEFNRTDLFNSVIIGYSVYAFFYISYKVLTFKVAKFPLKQQNKED